MDAQQETPENSGGKGGEDAPCQQTSDTRLVEKAIRQRWPIPEDARAKIAEGLAQVAGNKRASHRNRIAAARALTAMDMLNMEQEKRDLGLSDWTGNVNVNVRLVNQALTDDATRELLCELEERLAAAARTVEPGRTGADGQQGQVDSGAPPGTSQP